MKNHSAPKLLRMALHGEHQSYCPHKTTKLMDCKCWFHEVGKWEERMKQASTNRVRKGKPFKVHFDQARCSSRSRANVSNVSSEVTCAQCLKSMNRPAKKSKRAKANHLSLVLGVP